MHFSDKSSTQLTKQCKINGDSQGTGQLTVIIRNRQKKKKIDIEERNEPYLPESKENLRIMDSKGRITSLPC